jgi:arylsulfatase A-like enzyme
MFLVHGPNIEPAGDIGTISILDIAPTILQTIGLDIPEDFEGEPITQINREYDQVTYREPLSDRGRENTGSDDKVKERLADLGYLE